MQKASCFLPVVSCATIIVVHAHCISGVPRHWQGLQVDAESILFSAGCVVCTDDLCTCPSAVLEFFNLAI